MGHWLKTLGRSGHPLDADWLGAAPERRRVTYFPRRPRMERGDRLVLYAAGWQAVFAVGEVSSDGPLAEPSPSDPRRWPWAIHMRLHLLVPDLESAPAVEAIGVIPRSLSQHSHISITEAQYRRAVDALADSARRW